MNPSVTGIDNTFVLMYHHIGEPGRLASLAPFVVSAPVFDAQLDMIVGLDESPGTLSATIARGNEARESRRVVLTFDDCPAALVDHAIPALEQRGFKATFFVVAGKAGGSSDWERTPVARTIPLMGWRDLRELAAHGHEIAAHGLSHRSLRSMSRADALVEMRASREEIEHRIGSPVRSFAYPYGDVPDAYPDLCHEAGYTAACSIFSMSARVLDDPFVIRRILASERDAGLRFRFKLSRQYLWARPRMVDRRVLRKTGSVPDVSPVRTG